MRRDISTLDVFNRVIDEHLPARDLWPERVYRLPALQYPDTLNLADRLLDHARVDPGKTAIVTRSDRMSYHDLRLRVLSLAGGLLRVGIRPADRVALRLPNGPDFIAAWLAVQWVGAIGVQLSPLYRRREIERVANHSGASVIVCASDSLGSVEAARAAIDARIVSLDDLAGDPIPSPAHPNHRDQPALITYITSADGPLKGVVHSPADILASVDTYARDVIRLTSADVCIGTVSLAWAFGLGALMTFPLRAGATSTLVDGPVELLGAVAASRATILFGVPTMYRTLLRHPDLGSADLRSLRCCVSAAEPLPADVAEQWRARTGLEILDGLGTTELTHVFISARPGAVRPGLVGTPVAGYEARIVDENFHELPDGVLGQLAVRGPTGALYWRDADAQRRAVRHGWTLTGDLCVRHADGWFQHLRRTDALIVSAGYKISIREVEDALIAHPGVSAARVFAVPDPVRGAVAAAVVTPAPHADASTLVERLQQYLKAELAPFKCPRAIRIQ
ncbi:MAG TPA: AMP-binding protein [Vicinamibacterales bacterium]|nr:AMP-binding protein [Vicinamibacterales bacterium]